MDAKTVLKQLEAMGAEQTRKTYKRHGITGDMYGVSYANLGKLTKQIKCDHQLALQLWNSGNHDARILATMIGDPQQTDARQLEAWAKDLEYGALAGAFSGFASKSPAALKKIGKWNKSTNEWIGGAGWTTLAHLAREENDLPDAFFEAYLDEIESGIHKRKNFVRYSMNSALIAIGVRNPSLQAKALAAAKKIGRVEVDHGDTSCKTPDATEYIMKTSEKRKKKICA